MKVSIRKIIVFIFLLFLIEPAGMRGIFPAFSRYFYDIGFVIDIVIILNIYAYRKIRLSKLLLAFSGLFLWGLLVTIFGSGVTRAYVTCWMRPLLLLYYMEIAKKNLDTLAIDIKILLEIYTIINLFCLIRFPDGMYELKTMSRVGYTACWFLGYKSSFQYYLTPLYVLAIWRIDSNKEKAWNTFIIILIHIETVLAFNAMLIVGLLVLDGFYIASFVKKAGIMKLKIYYVIITAANIAIIFAFTKLLSINLISYAVDTILGKTSSLMRRQELWKIGLENIPKKLLTGYGYLTTTELYSYFKITQTHLHNQFLDMMIKYGVVGLALFLFTIHLCMKKAQAYANHNIFAGHICTFVFVIFLMVTVEIFTAGESTAIWFIIFLGYYSSYLKTNQTPRSLQ